MLTRSNEHVTKFNQLVEVYEPEGVAPLERVTSTAEEYLEDRRAEISGYRSTVEGLGAADFFDEGRRREIRESEEMPSPSAVAQSQRSDLLERLDRLDEALSEAIENDDVLDTGTELDL